MKCFVTTTLIVSAILVRLVWTSSASAAGLTFGPPVNLGPQINSGTPNFGSSISADGLSLYYTNNVGGFQPDIYVSTRATAQTPWGASVPLAGPVNTPDHFDVFPSISPDGLELYFGDNLLFPQGPPRTGGFGGGDIWRA